MPAKVIIQLEADASGLTPGIEAVEKLGKVDKATADQFKAANKAFQDRGKTLDQSAAQTEKFAQATKKLVESIAGGAINQATENIKKHTKEVESASADYKALNDAVSLVKKQLSTLNPSSTGFSKLEKELQAAELAMGNFTKAATSSRAQLRQYREALTQLEDAGLEGTQVFNDLAVAAGKLDDQVGDTQARIKALASDTFKFDAAIQAVQGLAGGFAIAQGAAALFGDESEEVQQALLKVNAAMAILQGLQQIQSILQSQSTLSLAAQIALQRISVLQTNLQAAAESRFTIIRVAATAAQATLNAVMAANPAALVLIAIGALAAGLIYLTSKTDDEANSQAALAKQLELTNQSIQNQKEIIDSLAESDDRELSLLRARGLEGSKLEREQIRIIKGQIARNESLIESSKGVVGAEETYSKALLENVRLRSDLRIKEAELTQTTIKENSESLKKAIEEEKKLVSSFLRDQVAANELAVAEATDSFRKFEAEVQLIEAKLRQTLTDPDLGANERILAEVKAGQEILKIRQGLFGELSKIETNHTDEIRKNLNSQVLAGSQAAQKRLQDEQASALARIAIAEQEVQKKQALQERLRQFQYDTAMTLAGSLLEIARNQAQEELDILQNKYDSGLISQKQYDQEQRAIRRRAAVQEKQMALFQATLAQSLAILSVLKDQTIPAPLKPVFIALAAAQAIAQLSAIASRPIPAFKKGTKNAPAGPALVGEAGPELLFTKNRLEYAHKPMVVDLNKGDKVIPAFDTARIMSTWNVPVPSSAYTRQTDDRPIPIIDYSKIGQALGKQLKKMPINAINMDERGYSERQIKQYQYNSYIKSRYQKPR